MDTPKAAATAGLAERKWTKKAGGGPGTKIRVFHWNILADKLSGLFDPPESKKVFVHAKDADLEWTRRGGEIVKFIKQQDPDVFSLVELDQFEDIMKRLGGAYEGLVQLRDGKADGTGIFWRKGLFTAGKNLMGHVVADGKKTQQALLAVQLTHTASKKSYVQCAIHLKSDKKPKGEVLRQAQIKNVLEELEKTFGTDLPLVLNSDLNSSHVVLLGGSRPIKAGEAMNEKSYKPTVYPYLTNDARYGFKSAYKEVAGQEPWATSVKIRPDKKYSYTIDYIFCSRGVTPVAVLDVYPEAAIPAEAFPSGLYPSDHELICADLLLWSKAVTVD